MVIVRVLKAILTSCWLWTFIGLALLGAVIWIFGAFVSFGSVAPLADPTARLAVIAGLFILWLIVWMILAQRRAIRANRLFVAELAVREAKTRVDAKFQQVLVELKRRALGWRLLREMPWYIIIGPPQSGKTSALHRSDLEFPFHATPELQEVGDPRTCRWFFTSDAVFINPSFQYTSQLEWISFVELLKKHRGSRALNGIIVVISIDYLHLEDNKLNSECNAMHNSIHSTYELIGIRIPIYFLITKMDTVRGFRATFSSLSREELNQVWGFTFPSEIIRQNGDVSREFSIVVRDLKRDVLVRLLKEDDISVRYEIHQFPSVIKGYLSKLSEKIIKVIIDEDSNNFWLRGIFFTSTSRNESKPSDNVGYFLRDVFRRVIFREAGLASLGPTVGRLMIWIRGAAEAVAFVVVMCFIWAAAIGYPTNSRVVEDQAREFEQLRVPLAASAARQVPRDLSAADLRAGLDAVAAVDAARAPLPGTFARLVGPSAVPEVEAAQETAYASVLRDMLEPRMVALLESTMWRQIRDPDIMLDALKTYRMMTGGTAIDPDFVSTWWTQSLPPIAAVPPFPDEAARVAQLEAIARIPADKDFIAPDEALVTAALRSICSIPLAKRAYAALLSDPAVTGLRNWVPAAHAGPNGSRVFTRHSGKSLRIGVRGVYTYAGYHDVVLPRLDDVAAQAAHDAALFTGSCVESAEASPETLAQDMLKLYYDDYIAQWDGLLHDLTLVPLTDLSTASENLKDLASADSALRRLLTAVVAETDLARPPDPTAASIGVSKYLTKLGKLGEAAKTAAKYASPLSGSPRDMSGQAVSDHFRPLKGTIAEVDGAPPSLNTAVVALTALSNTLQTVAASPDPDQAIKDQGGLAQLTGAVANEAALLPDPVDAWLRSIAGDNTTSLTREAVVSQINAAWAADVLDWCRAVAGRYPIDPGNPSDISAADFARVFGPGQLIDTFVTAQIKPFVDMTSHPWKWRGDLGLDDAALAPLEQAGRIRDALFPAGTGPTMAFTLEPKDLSPSAARVTLNLDGQSVVYFNNSTRPQSLTWPSPNNTGVITLAFEPIDGSPAVMEAERGPWAWLRMLRGALTPGLLPEVFKLRLATQGQWADFELRANSADNPFDLKMFSNFTCPARF